MRHCILHMCCVYTFLWQIITLPLSLPKKKKSWSFSSVLKYTTPQSHGLNMNVESSWKMTVIFKKLVHLTRCFYYLTLPIAT